MPLVVALASCNRHRRDLIDGPQILFGERDIRSGRILFQVLTAFGAGYGYYIAALGEQPGKRQLARGYTLIRSYFPDAIDQF